MASTSTTTPTGTTTAALVPNTDTKTDATDATATATDATATATATDATTTATDATATDTSSTMPPNIFTDPIYVSVFVVCLTAIGGIVYYMYLGNGSDSSSGTTDSSSASGFMQSMSGASDSTPSSSVGSGTYMVLGLIVITASLMIAYYVLEKYYGYDISTKFFGGSAQTGPEFDLDFNQNIDPAPTPTPIVPTPAPQPQGQVFNIPDNVYSYDDAKTICKAFGAELATYDQIENAYQNGAEWGNYGWSAEQMAFFPTQKETYDTLQKIPNHEHDRGRIGINGGYIANPSVQFGANCYGKRPAMTTEDEERMMNTIPYPQTAQEVALDNKVNELKNLLDDVIVSPFNQNKWSEY